MLDHDALVRRIARHEFPDPRVVPVRDRDGRPAGGLRATDTGVRGDDPAELRRVEQLVRGAHDAGARGR
ncbi:unannotated protein [freshwater metagenome]|uniref:Unannotated protein n=1 Tax=freshwater metagenome TaxID=449393 RepID=A0A6J7JGK3_9ZZZZ|nr:hypothetical protein [Actinomycetota bacterium]